MTWQTPTLATVRANNRDYIAARLQAPMIPNSQSRVLADANAGNAHLALQYLDWMSLQLLPDTAEQIFIDKWANIFLVNADGTRGRKNATYASGSTTIQGIAGTQVPAGQILTSPGANSISFQTTSAVTIGSGATAVPVRALVAGSAGNLAAGTVLAFATALPGVSGTSGATVVALAGGTDQESTEEVQARVLLRIRQPPMGGDADDYVQWALEVAGVTRAWCSPREMGPGTVTVRFMCDDLRATSDPTTSGFPTDDDIAAVTAFLTMVMPVTVDLYVVAPVPEPIDFSVTNLVGDSAALRAAIATSVGKMLASRAAPAFALNGVPQSATTIPAAWVSDAIYQAVNGVSFDLTMSDHAMPNPGALAVLGTIGS